MDKSVELDNCFKQFEHIKNYNLNGIDSNARLEGFKILYIAVVERLKRELDLNVSEKINFVDNFAWSFKYD